MASQTSYVHLSIVYALYTDSSFNVFKKIIIPAFQMLTKEQLFRSAIVI